MRGKRRALVVAVAVAAVLLPATAATGAGPDRPSDAVDLHEARHTALPDAVERYVINHAPVPDVFERYVARSLQPRAAAAPSPIPAPPAVSAGFDWQDAGVGAAVAAALCGLAVGAQAARSRYGNGSVGA
jgi:hypothetical protein